MDSCLMLLLLPRSYYYYTEYLMKTERFRQWVDLQLSHQISPASLYTEQLKAVEKADPTLLLPLYHQAVEKAVAEKNRASYKIAVRYLKKLFTIYKRHKQSDRWENYIIGLPKNIRALALFKKNCREENGYYEGNGNRIFHDSFHLDSPHSLFLWGTRTPWRYHGQPIELKNQLFAWHAPSYLRYFY